mmetsp:Transcript_9246/g.11666  ORF Transcript_9246/g.11666 Transcript_9246/m.11666 type:complete len:292 (+) Transcript_9246:208-1083(+)
MSSATQNEELKSNNEFTASKNNTDSMADKKGININEAMSILSTRADDGGDKDLQSNAALDPQLKQMGQTLDLMSSQEWTRGNQNCGHNSSKLVNDEREKMAKQSRGETEEDSETAAKMKQELSKLKPVELLQTLFRLQKDRVAAYQKWNEGLNLVLKSGNFSQYPQLTNSITATFIVLSNSINEIKRLLQSTHNMHEIGKFIEQLQSFEKEQLHYTAALHLEKIRERNELLSMELSSNNTSDQSNGKGSNIIAGLLRESCSSLQGKVGQCIQSINEVLEELRYAAADIDDT